MFSISDRKCLSRTFVFHPHSGSCAPFQEISFHLAAFHWNREWVCLIESCTYIYQGLNFHITSSPLPWEYMESCQSSVFLIYSIQTAQKWPRPSLCTKHCRAGHLFCKSFLKVVFGCSVVLYSRVVGFIPCQDTCLHFRFNPRSGAFISGPCS